MKKNAPALLIVEDDEVLLKALHLIFSKGKYTLATTTDGEKALEMAERLKPNLILLDLLLPKMNGFELLKALKARTDLAKIPVIVISNLGDKDSKEKAAALGALAYYVKSDTELSVLKSKVEEILKS
jgi:CheY-like chemotaxis protein